MALTDIVANADIHTELGGTLGVADLALLDSIRGRTERSVRNYVRWAITEATYTHYLPAYGVAGPRLQLPQPFVSAVTSVHEDTQSRGGQQAGDFGAGTELTAGTDFWIDYDESNYSREGILFRNSGYWSSFPRSIKVVYTSGFNAAALADEFLFIQQAVINETIDRFHYRKERQGASGVSGTVKSEKLKDYSISYAVGADSLSPNSSGLSDSAQADLDPIMFMGRML
jgi:hypothetical protein